jgi:hypothetical protein
MGRARADRRCTGRFPPPTRRVPTTRAVSAISEGPCWTYTTVLNSVFLAVAALLVVRVLGLGQALSLERVTLAATEGRAKPSDRA